MESARTRAPLPLAEAALVESEARFRSVFESSPIGIALVGLDGTWLRINPAVSRITGYGESELAGRGFQSITHPEDLDLDLGHASRLLAGEIPSYQLHKRYLRKDGRSVWCLLSVTLLRDEHGEPLHFLSQIVDVDAERSASQLLDAVFAASPDLVLVTTADARVVRANAAWARVLGWSEAELQGMDLVSLIHPDDTAAAAPGDLRRRLRFRRKDGGHRWLDWSAGQVPGHPLIVATARDATEEVSRERALRVAEEQARAAFEASPLGMAIADPSGELRQVNAAYARMVGRSATDLVGTSWYDLTHPDDLAGSVENNRLVCERATTPVDAPAEALTYEKRFLRPDGAVVWVSVGLTTITGADGRPLVLAETQDVTARKEAEARAARQMDRLRTTLAVQREVLATADRAAVLQLVADRAGEAVPTADGAVVELADGGAGGGADGGDLRYVCVAGTMTGAEGTLISPAGSLSGAAMTSRSTLRCDDAACDPRVDAAVCQRLGIVSMLIAPVFADGRPIGALKVTSRRAAAFTVSDEQQLTLLADALSGALRHAADAARSAELLTRAQLAVSALAASEARFYSAFASSPLGMVLANLREPHAGSLILVNEAMATLTGHPADDLVGASGDVLVHPDERPAAAALIARLRAGELGEFTTQRRFLHADGHVVWVEVHGAVVHDESGVPLHLVAQFQDVTADRQLRAELAERAKLLDLAQDAVVVRELDGRIRSWNPGAEQLYGWTATDAVGRDIDELLDTRRPGGSGADDVRSELLTSGTWTGELEHRRADGRRVLVLSRKALQRDREGRPTAVLSITTDITARRAAEDALAVSEQLFRSQFTHAAVGMILRDADGVVEQVNAAAAAMLRCAPEDLVGRHISSVIPPRHTDQWQEVVAQIFAGERESFEDEGVVLRPDGTLLPVHLSVAVIRDRTGKPERFIGIYQDVSDRAAAEAARDAALDDLAERNRTLEATNQLKADLMGMLGHEIGNPLATILGYTEMARAGWSSLSPADQEGLVATIDRNARRVDTIVREVLEMVALDAGRLTAAPEPVVLLDRLVAAAAGTGAVVDCPPGLTALVQPSHLDHVLTNLVSNATKYAGGPTAVRAVARGEGVELRVEDAGPGIPAPFRDVAFDRFTRDPATAGRTKGSGLGLHIVRELVQANGGTVGVQGAPAGGAAFVVVLPAADRTPD